VQDKERWQDLCEQAAVEQDSKKLIALIQEINRLVDEKLIRVTGKVPPLKPH
jgi:hypothetical protein